MTQRPDVDELRALPLDERLKLIEELWDSIAADNPEMPEWHREEIDRRLDALNAGAAGSSWDAVRRRITRES